MCCNQHFHDLKDDPIIDNHPSSYLLPVDRQALAAASCVRPGSRPREWCAVTRTPTCPAMLTMSVSGVGCLLNSHSAMIVVACMFTVGASLKLVPGVPSQGRATVKPHLTVLCACCSGAGTGDSVECRDAVQPATYMCGEKNPYAPCDANDYCEWQSLFFPGALPHTWLLAPSGLWLCKPPSGCQHSRCCWRQSTATCCACRSQFLQLAGCTSQKFGPMWTLVPGIFRHH